MSVDSSCHLTSPVLCVSLVFGTSEYGRVTVNGIVVSCSEWKSGKITCDAPPGAGLVPVTVRIGDPSVNIHQLRTFV
jgi:hypothetical protein